MSILRAVGGWSGVWLLAVIAARGLAVEELPLSGETVVRFASLEEGQAAIAAEDDFVRTLSRFDLQAGCKRQTT